MGFIKDGKDIKDNIHCYIIMNINEIKDRIVSINGINFVGPIDNIIDFERKNIKCYSNTIQKYLEDHNLQNSVNRPNLITKYFKAHKDEINDIEILGIEENYLDCSFLDIVINTPRK